MLRGVFKYLKGCQHGRGFGIARISLEIKIKMQGVDIQRGRFQLCI